LDGAGLSRVHIFAHHTGTHFATEMAGLHPDRVASLMLNGIAYLTAEERAKFAATVQPPEPPDPDGKYMAGQFARIAGLLPSFDPALFHEEMIGAFQSHFSRHKSFAAIWGQDYPAALARVRCPILATCAENEFWRPYFDRVFVARPDAKRMVLGPAKFYTPELDAPATVAAIRAFLAEIGG
jgi:pimeloyl-ACP methyl ester carboxylesterase